MWFFIIHPCDPTVVICYLIWPCDMAIPITYLISHSYSLTYNSRIFQFGCIITTKLPSCDDIIHCASLGFPSWCPESTRPTDSCFQGTSCKNLMMYGGLYQHTRVVLYIYQGEPLSCLMPYGAKPQCMESTTRTISCGTICCYVFLYIVFRNRLIRTVGQGPLWQKI